MLRVAIAAVIALLGVYLIMKTGGRIIPKSESIFGKDHAPIKVLERPLRVQMDARRSPSPGQPAPRALDQ